MYRQSRESWRLGWAARRTQARTQACMHARTHSHRSKGSHHGEGDNQAAQLGWTCMHTELHSYLTNSAYSPPCISLTKSTTSFLNNTVEHQQPFSSWSVCTKLIEELYWSHSLFWDSQLLRGVKGHQQKWVYQSEASHLERLYSTVLLDG